MVHPSEKNMEQEQPSSEPKSFSLMALHSFLAAARFLTVLPVDWGSEKDVDHLKSSLYFFPVVGSLIGLLVGCLASVLSSILPQTVVAAICVVLLIIVSGGLHMDGLADCFDGLFSSRDRARMLEIMRDSHIGVMGVIAVVSVFALKWSALSGLHISQLFAVLFLIPLSGRVAMLFVMAFFNYIRGDQGLGSPFLEKDRKNAKKAALLGVILYLFCLFFFPFKIVALSFIVTLFTVAIFGYYCRKMIGGYTGDTLGAVCEVTEMTVAIALVLPKGVAL